MTSHPAGTVIEGATPDARTVDAADLRPDPLELPPRLTSDDLQDIFPMLSAREIDVTTRLVYGDRVPAIAKALFLSQSTIRNHLSATFRKTGAASQHELIRLAQAARIARTAELESKVERGVPHQVTVREIKDYLLRTQDLAAPERPQSRAAVEANVLLDELARLTGDLPPIIRAVCAGVHPASVEVGRSRNGALDSQGPADKVAEHLRDALDAAQVLRNALIGALHVVTASPVD